MTQEFLKTVLKYNSKTGIFTRIGLPSSRSKIGAIVGSNNNGYLDTSILGVRYYLHRLAWIYEHGVEPLYIDHIDGNRSNNAISNLRSIDKKVNHKNMKRPKSNTSGTIGVYKHTINKNWIACICIDGKTKHLGSFDSKIKAVNARLKAEKDNGFHTNHGR